MLSGPSFRSAYIFSINSLILSGFPLTSFHLAEASVSAFLCSLVCAVAQKYHVFYTHFAINLFFVQLKNVNKLWDNNRIVNVNERY